MRLGPNQFYCVACAAKVTCNPKDMSLVKLKNKKVKGGVPALKCKCPSCGTTVYKFVKR